MESFFTKGPVKTEEGPMTTKTKKAAFNRQYQENYLKYGFTMTGNSHAPSIICIICGDRFSSEKQNSFDTWRPCQEDAANKVTNKYYTVD